MDKANDKVHFIEHPLVAARLSVLRARQTPPEIFRRHLQDISVLLYHEASRGWGTRSIEVETPLAPCAGAVLAKPIVLVPILRAGLGMLDGIQRVPPAAPIGHSGLPSSAKTLRPVTYYDRVPVNVAAAEVLLLDPMLATGNSACEAASILTPQGAISVQLLCIVACPPGVEQFQRDQPDVAIVTAAIDPMLSDHGYIVSGLGGA